MPEGSKNEEVFEDGVGGKWMETTGGVLEFMRDPEQKTDPMKDTAETSILDPKVEYNSLLLKEKRTADEQKRFEVLYEELKKGKKQK